MFRAVLCLCALTLAALAPKAAQAQPAKIPTAAFARMPAVERPVISPDGRRLAYVGGTAEERVIFITPLDGDPPVTIKVGSLNIKSLRWAGNRNLLAQMALYYDETAMMLGQKIPYTFLRDLVIDAATGDVHGELLRDRGMSRLALELPVLTVVDGEEPFAVVQGMAMAQDDRSNSVLNNMPDKGQWVIPTLLRVGVGDAGFRITERGSRQTWGFATDLGGGARLRWDYDDINKVVTLLGRRKGAGAWGRIEQWKIDGRPVEVLGYSDPDDAVIIRRETAQGGRIVRRGLADGVETDIGPSAPGAFADVVWDDLRRTPVAIVTGQEKPAYEWLDAELGAVHARLSKAFAGKAVRLADWSADRQRLLIEVQSPASPPVWYLYDQKSRQASLVGESYPELAAAALPQARWITYKARDGLEIGAYLTLPAGASAERRPALIVLPHDGPADRDDYAFNWLAQFLVSRGYAVLQPQFRGSDGFGAPFREAGYGEWAGKMRGDLADGVAAAASHGVDSGRACIVGHGYGGHAALAGAAFDPKTYRCGVSINGDADLLRTADLQRRTFGAPPGLFAYWRVSLTNPKIDGKAMSDASPAARLGGTASPILVFQSDKDSVTPHTQGEAIDRALTRSGSGGRVIPLTEEDHDVSTSRNRLKLLQETEAFLGKHLPVAP